MTLVAIPCELQSSGTIELYFYGELGPAEHDAVTLHLSGCHACRGALEELTVIRAALAARPAVAAPLSGDWTAFMARLDRSVAQTKAEGTRSTARRIPYAGYLAMAALLALVTMSVLFTARSRSAATVQPSRVSTEVSPPVAPAERAPNAAFAELSDEHLERSKLVVLGLATKDPSRASRADWQYERSLASSLLTDTRMYRMAAEDRGMQAVAGVMRDLELVLLQASLTDDADPAALAQIQRVIRKRDLLEKMNMVTTTGL